VHGKNIVPLNQWVHIAYTYDPRAGQGSIYINGKLDRTADQKPYAGPLDMIGSSLGLEHGKFAIDDVLITRGFMDAGAIAELAINGVPALQNADLTTDWEVLKSPVKTLKTWAEIPAGTSITVIAESAGDDGQVIGSSTIKLSSGQQTIPLTQLKQGTRVRLRIKLSAVKWDVSPVLQTAVIDGGNGKTIRWSTKEEWQKGKASGGLMIGQ